MWLGRSHIAGSGRAGGWTDLSWVTAPPDTGHRHTGSLCQLEVGGAALAGSPKGTLLCGAGCPPGVRARLSPCSSFPKRSPQTEGDGESHRSLLRTKLFLSTSARQLGVTKPLTWNILSPDKVPPASVPSEPGLELWSVS